MTTKKSQKGMSLVEVMIAIGLFSFTLFVIGTMTVNNRKRTQQSSERGDILNIFNSVVTYDMCKTLQLGINYLQGQGLIPPNSYDTSLPNKITPAVQYSGTIGIGPPFAEGSSVNEYAMKIYDSQGNEAVFQNFYVRLRPAQLNGLSYFKFEYKGNPPRVSGNVNLTTWGDPYNIATNKRILANVFTTGVCATDNNAGSSTPGPSSTTSGGTASPTASPTPTATASPTSSPTPTPTATATASPTPTPTPTIASTPTPLSCNGGASLNSIRTYCNTNCAAYGGFSSFNATCNTKVSTTPTNCQTSPTVPGNYVNCAPNAVRASDAADCCTYRCNCSLQMIGPSNCNLCTIGGGTAGPVSEF